jgi:hypothetical protein
VRPFCGEGERASQEAKGKCGKASQNAKGKRQKPKVKTHKPALWSAASIAATLFFDLFSSTVNPVAFHFALYLLHFAF